MSKLARGLVPRSRVFRRLLLVNLLLCVMSASILCAVFLPFMRRNAETIDENWNQSRLFAIQAYWDTLRADAEGIVRQIEQSDWIYPLFIDHVLSGNRIPDSIRTNIYSDMGSFRIRYPEVQSVSFWFYREPNEIYSSQGIFSDWGRLQTLLPEKIDYAYLPLEGTPDGFSSVEHAGTAYLSYRTVFQDVPNGSDKGEIVIIFYTEKLQRQFFSTMDQSVAALSVLSHDGELLYSVSLSDSQAPTFRITEQDGNYIYEIELFLNFRENTHYQIAVFAGMAVFFDLLTCVILSLVLTYFNYRPFGAIIRNFIGEVPSGRNEFEYLSQTIQDIQQSCTQQAVTITQLQPLVQDNIVSHILSGTSSLSGSFEEYLASGDVEFPFPVYNVVIIALEADDFKQTILDAFANSRQSERHLRFYLHIIGNDRLALLINYKKAKELEDLVHSLASQFRREGWQFHIGVGKPQETWEQVYLSYEQARTALSAAFLNRSGNAVWYSMISTAESGGYDYSYSEEVLFSQAIIEGRGRRRKDFCGR